MSPPDPSRWTLPRLRIDRDGDWFHEDAPVSHPGILASLRGNLQVDERGYYVQTGPVRVPVEVDDTAFVVVRVEREGDRLLLTLNDLSREPLAPDTLRLSPDNAPYCRVKGGRFEARASRAAAYQLLQHAEYDERDGRAALVIGRARHPLPVAGGRPPRASATTRQAPDPAAGEQ